MLPVAHIAHPSPSSSPRYDPIEFMGVLADKMDVVGMSMDFIGRDVNSGFSGGRALPLTLDPTTLVPPPLHPFHLTAAARLSSLARREEAQ